jgi:hypothetical protein
MITANQVTMSRTDQNEQLFRAYEAALNYLEKPAKRKKLWKWLEGGSSVEKLEMLTKRLPITCCYHLNAFFVSV